jgi:hypothetical protein
MAFAKAARARAGPCARHPLCWFSGLSFYDYDLVWKQISRSSARAGIPAFLRAPSWMGQHRALREARPHLSQRFTGALRALVPAAVEITASRPDPEQTIFVNAWNEWAEGATWSLTSAMATVPRGAQALHRGQAVSAGAGHPLRSKPCKCRAGERVEQVVFRLVPAHEVADDLAQALALPAGAAPAPSSAPRRPIHGKGGAPRSASSCRSSTGGIPPRAWRRAFRRDCRSHTLILPVATRGPRCEAPFSL